MMHVCPCPFCVCVFSCAGFSCPLPSKESVRDSGSAWLFWT